MNTLSYKTKSANKNTVDKKWVLIDAEGQILGRLATEIAFILRGKNKPEFTPHVDTGDNVIVINADKIRLTGNKWEDKEYVRFSGYPGGKYTRTASEEMARMPEFMVEKAVKGMLPKNRLGADLFRNLHVYAGGEHKHEAQKPRKVEVGSVINHNERK